MDKVVRFNLIQQIGESNAHGKIWIARTDDEYRHLVVVKEPNNVDDAKDLHLEYEVFEAIGPHANIVSMIEYHE